MKRKRRIILLLTSMIIIVVFMVLILSFASEKRKNALCSGVDVIFEEKTVYSTKAIENIVYIVHNLKSKLTSLNTEARTED